MLNLFYVLINHGYRLIFGGGYMLHAPLFSGKDDSFFQAQANLTDHCMSFLPPLKGACVLDIGCGNGIMTQYILRTYTPSFICGVDIVSHQIALANKSIAASEAASIKFSVDDAQRLDTVNDASFDIVVCLESALHYPDKEKFLFQVSRVLKPGGFFLIADLLRKESRKPGPVQKKLHLFNWSHAQYLAAFPQKSLELVADDDLNQLLLPHFKKAGAAIAKDIKARRPFTLFFVMMMVRPVLWLYHYQLRKLFQYRLFVGRHL